MGVVSPICAGIYGELGQVHFHWCNFDQVENYLQRSAQLSGMGSFSDAAVFYAVARSRLFQMRGDWDAAAREIQKAADFTRTDTPVVVREEVVAQQVNVYLAQNNLAAAEQALFQAAYSLAGQRAWPALTSSRPKKPFQCLSCATGAASPARCAAKRTSISISFATDSERAMVCAYAVFSGTHTGEGGPMPPTGESTASDYVYVMTFEGDRIRHMTKIWNAGWAMRELGWG